VRPSGQLVAVTTCVTGISDLSGGGSAGWGPVPAETATWDEEAQPARDKMAAARARRWVGRGAILHMGSGKSKNRAGDRQ
jgi:hypothetical protein